LLLDAEILDVHAGAHAQRIGVPGKLQPFGMNVQLDIMPAHHDRPDHILNRRRSPDQRGHGVDKEYRLDAMTFEHIHLIAHADRA
jgi:hypothetical protein